MKKSGLDTSTCYAPADILDLTFAALVWLESVEFGVRRVGAARVEEILRLRPGTRTVVVRPGCPHVGASWLADLRSPLNRAPRTAPLHPFTDFCCSFRLLIAHHIPKPLALRGMRGNVGLPRGCPPALLPAKKQRRPPGQRGNREARQAARTLRCCAELVRQTTTRNLQAAFV